MSKIGRNEPCPCKSGKKYKKCCEANEPVIRAGPTLKSKPFYFEYDDHDEKLVSDSNHVVDLINEGKYEEAELAAKKLLVDYPEVHDGFERLGALYEKTGDQVQAILMYQKALNFTLDKDNYNYYDDEGREYYRKKIVALSATAFNQA